MRAVFLLFTASFVFGQAPLPVRWEDLTAGDFVRAIEKSQGVCVVPFGILEKHGPHLPLGTDLINARYVSLAAAKQEFAIVFPEYYFGQIFEAKQEPGTIAYSSRLQLELLQETMSELSRNGCKKIIIVNGHGGNTNLLSFFGQSQLASARDYAVYIYLRPSDAKGGPEKKSKVDGHAGESETSRTLVSRPELVQMDKAGSESGANRNRLDLPTGVYTGIWWYARYPDHYAGDGTLATKELGEFEMKTWIDGTVNVIRAVKSDQMTLRLQQEFFDNARHPLDTKQ